MDYRIPVLHDGVELQTLTGEDEPHALKVVGTEQRVKLTAPAVALVMFIDGRRTVEQLRELAERLEMDLPETFLEQLLAALDDVDIISFTDAADLPHEVLPGTSHSCEGCGRSCKEHLVGPLPQSEERTIRDLWPELQEEVPRLEDARPFMKLPDRDGLFLAQEEGSCVFLADDNRCDIHRHFGAESKPSICRMFPFVRVLTEEGARIVVNPGCFRHHMHYERSTGEPQKLERLEGDLADLPQPTLSREITRKLPFSPPPREVQQMAARSLGWEARIMNALGKESCTLKGLMKALRNKPSRARPRPRGFISRRAVGRTAGYLKRFGHRVDLEDSVLGDVLKSGDSLGRSYGGLLNDIGRMSVKKPPQVQFERREEEYLLDCLRRLLFSRELLGFESPDRAFAAMIAGWIHALWAVARREKVADRFDFIGERFTAWYRFVTSPGNRSLLFDSESEARQLLSDI